MLSGPSHPSGNNTAMRRRACEAGGRAGGRSAAALLLVALAAAALGAGCGNDDQSTAPSHPGAIGPRVQASCDLYAAQNGSESAPGTRSRPFRYAEQLIDALKPGQTGCFRDGTYAFGDIEIRTPGITLAGYRNEHATLAGEIKVRPGGAGTTIEGLTLNGASGASDIGPRIYADQVTLRGNEITNDHQSICVSIGRWYSRPPPRGVVIERNRIHDCGALPSTNKDHGIYVSEARGTVIRDNWIYDNTDRGVQLYPDADGSRITGNVIDSNGEGIVFAGTGDEVSSGNLVADNVISNSKLGWNVYSNIEGESPQGNVLRHNCLWAGDAPSEFQADGGVEPSSGAAGDFSATGNVVADPRYADPAGGDYTLAPDSDCPLAGRSGYPAFTARG
jgi:parallel beta-helix repeat protein